MDESRNRLAVFGAVLVGLVLVVLVLKLFVAPSRQGAKVPGEQAPAEDARVVTRGDAPDDVVVPEEGTVDAPENVAVPENVVAIASQGTKFRSFTIEAKQGAYVPNTVIIKAGDTLRLSLTAVDGSYDIMQPDYRLTISALQGASGVFEGGGFTPGKFMFYCERCGGPDKGPVGYLIVTEKGS
jgi:hypothetical protein